MDEIWKNALRFLPDDPYKRAKIRLWASFLNQQLFEDVGIVITTDGEAQEKAPNDLFERLKVLEEGMKEFFPGGSTSINGENMGLLDILMCTFFGPYKVHEEVLGIKMINPERNPLLFSWLMALMELPVMTEINLPHEKPLALVHFIRQNALQSSVGFDHLILP